MGPREMIRSCLQMLTRRGGGARAGDDLGWAWPLAEKKKARNNPNRVRNCLVETQCS